jgi:endonuclease YncB( thermonuclease family)
VRPVRRGIKSALAIVGLLVLGLAWAFPEEFGLAPPPMRSASGERLAVEDGDTFRMGDRTIRLYGVDAPEWNQICKDEAGRDWQCGREARAALANLMRGRTISCQDRAEDRFNRIVANCVDEQGRDLARALAEQGMAISMGGFGDGPYVDEEAAAKAARRGLWRGAFDPPATWRATHPKSLSPAPSGEGSTVH